MYYIKSDDNIKIAVEDLNPKSKYPILLIHGWPLNHKIFEYQTGILSSLGYRVISVDLRGFGMSDVSASNYSYNRLATDIQNIINELGLDNVILCGFSMGGAIAIRYITLFSEQRISKLILLAAAAPIFTKRIDYPYGMAKSEVDKLIEQTLTDRPQMVVDFGKNFFGSNPSENLKLWFRDIGWNASNIGTIGTAKSLRDEDLRLELKNIHTPTGIFHGKLDKICPFEFGMILNNSIKNSVLFPYEKSGHAIFYDELEKFTNEFVSFIRK